MHNPRRSIIWLFGGIATALVLAVQAIPSRELPAPPTATAPMDNQRLAELLQQVDPEVSGDPGNWTLTVQDIPAYVITDEAADRMRILVPITNAADLDQAMLYRILQANFESALDARYAIAQDVVWSAFIHPLSPLTEDQLVSALAQTYNAALTFGESYSSGVFHFEGGDNRQDIYDEIMRDRTPS